MSADKPGNREHDHKPESAAQTPQPAKRGARLNRRSLLRRAAVGGTLVAGSAVVHETTASPGQAAAPAAGCRTVRPAQIADGTLDPTSVPKYVTALPILAAMPRTATVDHASIDFYSIAAQQLTQQILPTGFPASTVWGYGSLSSSGSFHAPAFPIEAQAGRQVRVRWANQLVDSSGNFLPHISTVDPALRWPSPPGGTARRDTRASFTSTPRPYTGPIPLVTHLHGAHVQPDSDGYPDAWYLPQARDIPAGYATAGSFYHSMMEAFENRVGFGWQPGTAVFQYANDQRATAMWFHDHTLGMTRVNVHAGLAGFFFLRGGPADLPAGVLPGPSPKRGDPPGTRYFEIPMVIQDRSFSNDGSLFSWNPESFGNIMVVNGRSWPELTVEPRRYRFRILNSCNARTLIMKIVTDPLAARPATAALPIWYIGADGGFLPAPRQSDRILQHVWERVDIIVDFTGIKAGTAFYLINEGPDQAFNGLDDRGVSDPGTTGQVMKFVVGTLSSKDATVPPDHLTLPPFAPLGAADSTRQISLSPLAWADPISEVPRINTTEIWELTNFTADAHPIHIHQVEFEVVNRQPNGGAVTPPEAWETGTKDTVIAYPGAVTRFKAHFDIPGRYVYHGRIADHEDNEMTRPYMVVSDQVTA